LTVAVQNDLFGGAVSFQWSGVPATIPAGTPFTATLTAKDASGHDRHGTVAGLTAEVDNGFRGLNVGSQLIA